MYGIILSRNAEKRALVMLLLQNSYIIYKAILYIKRGKSNLVKPNS